MPKILTADNARLEAINFGLNAGGLVTELQVTVNIGYGPMRIRETIDLFPELSLPQREAFNALHTRIIALLTAKYLT